MYIIFSQYYFIFNKRVYLCNSFEINVVLNSENAGVVKLVDTLDLGSSAARCGGSSPFTRTNKTGEYLLSCFSL